MAPAAVRWWRRTAIVLGKRGEPSEWLDNPELCDLCPIWQPRLQLLATLQDEPEPMMNLENSDFIGS